MNVCNFIDGTARIASSASVWHFAVVAAYAEIGEYVSIGSHAEVGRHARIGAHSRISKGVFLPAHSSIGENVFIGPNVTFTDDRYPRVGNTDYHREPPVVEDDVAIGAGCVILPGVRIGRGAMIGAGTVVVKDVPARIVLREKLSQVSSAHTL